MAFDSTFFDGASYDALELRQTINGGFLTHDRHPVTAREGVLSGLGATANAAAVTLQPGIAAVSPEPNSNRGTYVVAYEGGSLAFGAADAAYARVDAVVAKMQDDSYDGSGQKSLKVEVIPGTPAAAPVAPTVPTGSLLLHHVRVAAGSGTTSVTDKRVYTAAAGGILAGSSAERVALPTNLLRPGQTWTDTDTGIRRVWFNGRWTADQVVGWRGCVGAGGSGTLSIPPQGNFTPDINEVSGALGDSFNSMHVQRLSRKLKPQDGAGRYDVTWNVSVDKATAPGELWVGICLNNNDDPTSNSAGDLTGTIVAENHGPLSTSNGGFRGAPGTSVQVTAQGLRLTDSSTLLLYVWHDSANPVGMYFDKVRTYASVSRIGF